MAENRDAREGDRSEALSSGAAPGDASSTDFPPGEPAEDEPHVIAPPEGWPSQRARVANRLAQHQVSLVLVLVVAFCTPGLNILAAFVGMLAICYFGAREIIAMASDGGRLRSGQFQLKGILICTLAATLPSLCLRGMWKDTGPVTMAVVAVLSMGFALLTLRHGHLLLVLSRDFLRDLFESTRLSREPTTTGERYRRDQEDARMTEWLHTAGESAGVEETAQRPES